MSLFEKICTRVIEYGFYSILFLVPLVFTSNTSELFEFNKLWVTFYIVIVMAAFWIAKMISQKRIFIQKTPLDIPIGLFLLSHIISTIFSLDPHVSFWGYYSRFNGGLYSMLSYIFLYYAFVSNFPLRQENETHSETPDAITVAKRSIFVSLISGAIVALWGLPSHFGYDPTCLLFRGTFDVSCWTDAFQPRVRIFSTMGQPDWLAAYLAILLPISLAFGFLSLHRKKLFGWIYFLLSAIFFVDIIYTDARSGFVGIAVTLFVFLALTLFFGRKIFSQKVLLASVFGTAAGTLLLLFLLGSPITQLDQFTLRGISERLKPQATKSVTSKTKTPAPAPVAIGELGGTDSSQIRLIVWQGALNAWRDNPIFGTGVETFAFAYYKYRPAAHNMTSEWDYLYNKAHNEYLNYLTTLGAFGFTAYMLIIAFVLFLAFKGIMKHKEHREERMLTIALLSSFISILVINFFGFSVVIVNIYFFLLPLFVFVFTKQLKPGVPIFPMMIKTSQQASSQKKSLSFGQQAAIGIIFVIAAYQITTLIGFWFADTNYALGQNLNHIGQYQQAYPLLVKAVNGRPEEPVFKDELTNTYATIAVALATQKDSTNAAAFAQQAIALSDQLVQDYPNNVVFWKSRVRVFYTLAQVNPEYLNQALVAIKKASTLAPTDAKVSYNLGVIYGQGGDSKDGIRILEETIKLKPDYRDAYYALALFYRDQAIDKAGKVIDPAMQEKATKAMQYILEKIAPNDTQARDALKAWQKK